MVSIRINLDRLMFEYGNMKIPQLQELTGLNKNTLYNLYKNDVKRFDADTLEKVCKALGCEIGDLLEIIEDGE